MHSGRSVLMPFASTLKGFVAQLGVDSGVGRCCFGGVHGGGFFFVDADAADAEVDAEADADADALGDDVVDAMGAVKSGVGIGATSLPVDAVGGGPWVMVGVGAGGDATERLSMPRTAMAAAKRKKTAAIVAIAMSTFTANEGGGASTIWTEAVGL